MTDSKFKMFNGASIAIDKNYENLNYSIKNIDNRFSH